MSAVASSAPALNLYGIPLASGLTNGAGVAAPGNIVGVAGVPSNPINLMPIPKDGYYRFILNGFINGTDAPGITGATFFFYSDLAATVKVGDISLAFPPSALFADADRLPFTIQNTLYLKASAALQGLTVRVVVSGSSSTIYNSMPGAAAANQGLAIYWQAI